MKLMIATLLICNLWTAAHAELSPVEKDKILFMIFENQNKKVIFEKGINCKKEVKNNWICANSTVKNFLMNTFRAKSQHAFELKTDLFCDPITLEMQKNIEGQSQPFYGSLDFRREIRQSLKGQWLCRFQTAQNLMAGTEDMDDKNVFTAQADGSAKALVGLSFIMNRDKNRIVSRKFAAWAMPPTSN
jgi:hypothetical protein